MALGTSSISAESSRSEKLLSLIWGCHLNSKNRSFTFNVSEEWSYEQQLALRTICLGENAKDEFNVVEIIPPKDSKDSTPVRIATLKLSVLPMATIAGLDLTPPVTFRLKSGSGPVYLAGQHIIAGLQENGEEEEEELSSQEDEEMENSSKEESLVKLAKKPSNKRTSTAKKEQEQPIKEQPQGKRTNEVRKSVAKGELRI
ncbi:nucleoplasmin-like [Sceloporus undulatus]|uniref:nucleoplasmin-like n=1 Tax=Sceloporus undulatus TaxID=8520 RepID=UPI001C4C3D39|nr:nucleoplasmin-like [Sceloporus undulatus]